MRAIEYVTGVITGRTLAHREARFGYLFTLPVLLYVSVIFFVPLVYVLFLSTHTWSLRGIGTFIGLDGYAKTLKDPVFLQSLKNTFLFALISVPSTLIVSLLAALALQSRTRLPARNLFKTVYFMPLLVSFVAVAFVWQWMFNPSIGLLNSLLRAIGLPEQGWLNDPDQVLPSLAMMYVWARMGFGMVIFIAGLEGISSDYYDASSIDGASQWQKFWRITLPLLNPQIVLVVIFEMIMSLRLFDLPFIATSGGPVNASRTVVFHIYDVAFKYFRMSDAAAAAVVLFLIILGLTLLQRAVLSKRIDI